jgi:two-component system response regulator AtoC
VGSAEEALDALRSREFDVVLSDIHMPGMDGLGLLAELRDLRPETPVVLMTAFGSIRSAVEAMRAGAFDYVPKPFDLDTVLAALERALDRRALEEENRRLRRAVARVSSFGDLVGRSAAMNEIYAMIRRIAGSRSNVLISGESGTGKEVVARTIHFTGPRSSKPFVPINCTAMPEGLLESELFGHVRGAFTGAQSAKKGLFEEAQGGTLFLDEIGDMPLSLQGKLLRVLQDREVRPVGGNQQIRVDVRIVAATNKDLKREIERENFRKDLFYRLNVIPIQIPPLRERPEDVAVLAHSFVKKHGGERWHLSEKAIQKLQAARWDGNARELENAIERALVLASGQEIKAADILLSEDGGSTEESLVDTVMRLALQRKLSLRDLENLYVDRVLEGTGGQKSEAARILGVNRRTLYRRNQRKPAGSALDA